MKLRTRAQIHGSPRRGHGSLTTAILMVVTLVSAAQASEATPIEYPEIAGTTVIHGRGVTGVIVRVPKETSVGGHVGGFNLQLSWSQGTSYAKVGFRTQLPPTSCVSICYEAGMWALPGSGDDSADAGGIRDVSRFVPGLLEVYVITDGEVTLTAGFEGLSGTVEVTATGDVDGIVERVPAKCSPVPSCANFAYGGIARQVGKEGRPGYGTIVAYADIPNRIPPTDLPNQGSTSALACAYPSLQAPNGSTDPADHPYGCDTLASNPMGEDSGGNTLAFFGNGAQGFTRVQYSQGSSQTQGPAYLGFMVEAMSPLVPPAKYGAFAEWVNSGIECPSDDFFDCDKPHED